MPTSQESARRWSGFVCPDCRFVFRVARDHDGKGLVCPSCRRLLRLPGAEDALPPLLSEQFGAKDERLLELTGGGSGKVSQNVRRKRKRKRRSSQDPAWEATAKHSKREDGRTGLLLLAVGLITLIAVLAIMIIMPQPSQELTQIDDQDVLQEPVQPTEQVDAPPLTVEDDSVRRDNSRFLRDAHPIARAFLEATTVDELLEYVDRPEVVAERIKRYHPDGTITPLGLGDYSQFSQVRYQGPFGTVPLRTGDSQIRMMTFREYPDELKVDWESWVGWSELGWDDYLEQRPTGPHAFRVSMDKVEYYNFDFSDERKWQSVRLISPDREHSLYAYVERDSPAHFKLRSMLEDRMLQAMLEVQFPENPASGDQVEIIRVLADDWIDPERLVEP